MAASSTIAIPAAVAITEVTSTVIIKREPTDTASSAERFAIDRIVAAAASAPEAKRQRAESSISPMQQLDTDMANFDPGTPESAAYPAPDTPDRAGLAPIVPQRLGRDVR